MQPAFLIIGAMKSATTSLFRDLGFNPAIFVPEDKEPDALVTDAILTPDGRQAYESLFERAAADQICGEASTSYTKRSEYEDVPRRALEVLGPEPKLLYIVREPVERIVSHHHHDVAYGAAGGDIDRAVRTHRRYVDTSRYMWQLEPWVEAFGADHVLVIRFEDFVARRREVVDEASRFLGVAPGGHLVDTEKNFNPSDNRRAAHGLWRRVANSSLYRKGIRRLLPWQIRERVRHLILPKGPARPQSPSEETLHWLTEELREDVQALGQFNGGEIMWERWR